MSKLSIVGFAAAAFAYFYLSVWLSGVLDSSLGVVGLFGFVVGLLVLTYHREQLRRYVRRHLGR